MGRAEFGWPFAVLRTGRIKTKAASTHWRLLNFVFPHYGRYLHNNEKAALNLSSSSNNKSGK
jgi:hypothetical protein